MYHIKAIKMINCSGVPMQKSDIVAICIPRKDIMRVLHNKQLVECLSLMGYQRLDAVMYRNGVEYHTGYYNRIDNHTFSILPFGSTVDPYRAVLSVFTSEEY